MTMTCLLKTLWIVQMLVVHINWPRGKTVVDEILLPFQVSINPFKTTFGGLNVGKRKDTTCVGEPEYN